MSDRSADEARRYAAAIAWVESFIRPITGTAPPRTPADWEAERPSRLERLDAVLDRLGHPERRYRTFHVTGTSGKGSVCTFLGSVLRAAGYRTGVHATPYLQTPVEKLQVDGRYAPAGDVADLVEAFRSVMPPDRDHGLDLPYPALWVALTYLYFARRRVDVGVIEVSTGGRFDWTNTITPEVAVITTVGPDHLGALGPTLADVAYHKAGIIKQGRPSVTGVQPPELAIVEAEAHRRCSELRRFGHEFGIEVRSCTDAGTVFDYFAGERRREGLEIHMLGRHQAFNAALAVAALDAWSERNAAIPEEALRAGLRDAFFAGRMELIQRAPDVLLDGAHNPQKAAALAAALAEIFPERRLIVVLGALSNKDAAGIIRPLAQQARQFVVTAPHVLGKPAAEPERIAAQARALG